MNGNRRYEKFGVEALSGLQFCRDEYTLGAVPTVARQWYPQRRLWRNVFDGGLPAIDVPAARR